MSAAVVCPVCGSERAARIVYGMVTPDVLEQDDVIGGCVVDGHEPDRACRDCGHRWRTRPVPLRWPDPRGHADGEWVETRGTVGRVVLEATTSGGVRADFELIVADGLPRLTCVALPEHFGALQVALEPGLGVSLKGRITHSPYGAPELHVTEWVPDDA